MQELHPPDSFLHVFVVSHSASAGQGGRICFHQNQSNSFPTNPAHVDTSYSFLVGSVVLPGIQVRFLP